MSTLKHLLLVSAALIISCTASTSTVDSIVSELNSRSDLARPFDVNVEQRMEHIILSGTVSSAEDRERIEQIAMSKPGIKTVANKLQVVIHTPSALATKASMRN